MLASVAFVTSLLLCDGDADWKTDYAGKFVARAPVPSTLNLPKVVAFTFDDGPDNVSTPPILDEFKKRGEKATFFIIGNQIKRSPTIFQRTIADGHEIANHTLTHSPNSYFRNVDLEILKTNALIEMETVRPAHIFRPPYGDCTNLLTDFARSIGMVTVLWTWSSDDWLIFNPQTMANNFAANLKPGMIALFHDERHKPGTPKATGLCLDIAKARGYKVVTVSEMMRIYHKAGYQATE
jgi:peptidoglycan-N-acetylglucosamine deacetylase